MKTIETKKAENAANAVEILGELNFRNVNFVYHGETNEHGAPVVYRHFDGINADGNGTCFGLIEIVINGKLDTVRFINSYRETAVDIKIGDASYTLGDKGEINLIDEPETVNSNCETAKTGTDEVSETVKFEVGKTYAAKKSVLFDSQINMTVIKRTNCYVTIQFDEDEEDIRRCKIVDDAGVEKIYIHETNAISGDYEFSANDVADEIKDTDEVNATVTAEAETVNLDGATEIGDDTVEFVNGKFFSVFSRKYHAAIVKTDSIAYCVFNDGDTEVYDVSGHEISYDEFMQIMIERAEQMPDEPQPPTNGKHNNDATAESEITSKLNKNGQPLFYVDGKRVSRLDANIDEGKRIDAITAEIVDNTTDRDNAKVNLIFTLNGGVTGTIFPARLYFTSFENAIDAGKKIAAHFGEKFITAYINDNSGKPLANVFGGDKAPFIYKENFAEYQAAAKAAEVTETSEVSDGYDESAFDLLPTVDELNDVDNGLEVADSEVEHVGDAQAALIVYLPCDAHEVKFFETADAAIEFARKCESNPQVKNGYVMGDAAHHGNKILYKINATDTEPNRNMKLAAKIVNSLPGTLIFLGEGVTKNGKPTVGFDVDNGTEISPMIRVTEVFSDDTESAFDYAETKTAKHVRYYFADGGTDIDALTVLNDGVNDLLKRRYKLNANMRLLTNDEYAGKLAELDNELRYVEIQIDAVKAGDTFDYVDAAEHIKGVYEDVKICIELWSREHGLTVGQCEQIYVAAHVDRNFTADVDRELINRMIDDFKRCNAADTVKAEFDKAVTESVNEYSATVEINGETLTFEDGQLVEIASTCYGAYLTIRNGHYILRAKGVDTPWQQHLATSDGVYSTAASSPLGKAAARRR